MGYCCPTSTNNAEDDDLYCPITLALMRDPVKGQDGFTYEREAIVAWLARHGTSPLTRQPLQASLLVQNTSLREKVRLFRATHPETTPGESLTSEERQARIAKAVRRRMTTSSIGSAFAQCLFDAAASSCGAQECRDTRPAAVRAARRGAA